MYTKYLDFQNRGDDFRPDYGKLGVLAALFPNAHVAALTATATKRGTQTICSTICLRSPNLVIGNLDRSNIVYAKVFREASDNEVYPNILEPIAKSLLEYGSKYPSTLIYLSLPWCGRASRLFESILNEKQYDPVEGPFIPENRLFGQFHAPQTEKMQEAILKQLCKPESKCRVVFATSVRQVVHIGPPRSVREYHQESGRARRDNKKSWATLYYNNHPIKPGMPDHMRQYCRSTDVCLRKQLLQFLDAPPLVPCSSIYDCCDVCKSHCSCSDCTDDLMSYDQTAFCGVIMSAAAACCDDESDKIT